MASSAAINEAMAQAKHSMARNTRRKVVISHQLFGPGFVWRKGLPKSRKTSEVCGQIDPQLLLLFDGERAAEFVPIRHTNTESEESAESRGGDLRNAPWGKPGKTCGWRSEPVSDRHVLLDSPREQKYRHTPAQQDGRMAVGEPVEKPAPGPGDTDLDVGKTAWLRVRASTM